MGTRRPPSRSKFLSLLLLLSVLAGEDTVKRLGARAQVPAAAADGGGTWELLVPNAGIASMHTAIDFYGQAVFLDRLDAGPSDVNLTVCDMATAVDDDCSAHSVLVLPAVPALRPLTVLTDPWCSSGQFAANGTLVQTGGEGLGAQKIRYYSPCPAGGSCDWIEDQTQFLQAPRWYATDHILPDGRLIVVGGLSQPSLEFVPDQGEGLVAFPFLSENQDAQSDNLYPYVHLLPDGTLWIFCNQASVRYNYLNNTVMQTFPNISGEPRSYPSAGSSVLLPLQFSDNFAVAEILLCGGAQYGAVSNRSAMLPASETCGRLRVTDPAPAWVMETMPLRRCMGDMVLLPDGSVLIINGAQAGAQGFDNAFNPALNPVLYQPSAAAGLRFSTLNATTIPRMYHSTANLIPDGRIVVAGSNPNSEYYFGTGNASSGLFPTELRVEAFSPPYLDPSLAFLRPAFIAVPSTLTYGQTFTVVVTLATGISVVSDVDLCLQNAPFSTHSYSQGQRQLRLASTIPILVATGQYQIASISPASVTLAPPGYYMLFAVNQGVPSVAAWVQITP